ncbi:MAG: cell division protein FtsA [Verrucomicrobiota bacterium JB022]|nr:cell division protein FtsA [Verrucomicrobiota bacterium JB022]
MSLPRSKIIGAVEMGTSKIVVLVGEVHQGRSLNIIGMGQTSSNGIRKGEIVDMRQASDGTHAAILQAEKQAGAQIEGIYLSLSGSHLQGFSNPGMVTVADPDNFVTRDDLRRAAANAKSKALPPGRVYIHHVRSGFVLDGREVGDPIGMQGQRLEARYWHVHGDERKVSDALHVINGFGMDVDDVVLSSIAAGSMVATDAEKQAGVLVVDIGAGSTDYVLYRHGHIVRTGTLAVGGQHMSNDLSLGLRLPAQVAEALKLRVGRAIFTKDDRETTTMAFNDMSIGDRPIPMISISRILHARCEEIFTILKNRLGSQVSPAQLAGGVVLTGAATQLQGLPELAEHVLGVDVRRGTNPDWVVHKELRTPEYSTVLGLLNYGLRNQQRPAAPAETQVRKPRLLTMVSQLFK